VHDGRAARADGVGAHDLVPAVDAERRGGRSAGDGQVDELPVVRLDEPVGGACAVGVEAGHVALVVDGGRGQAGAGRLGSVTERYLFWPMLYS